MKTPRVFIEESDVPHDMFTTTIQDPYRVGKFLYVELTQQTAPLVMVQDESTNPFEEYDHLYNDIITTHILADSWLAQEERRVTTFKLHMPRIMLAELTRHRIYSYSVQSSRARSSHTKGLSVHLDPFIPQLPLADHKGMTGFVMLDDLRAEDARNIWNQARMDMLEHANKLEELEFSHQYTNRLLEPFMMVDVIMTGSEWDNFVQLRTDENAQFEIQVTARQISSLLKTKQPDILLPGEVHLPYTNGLLYGPYQLAMMSAGYTARTSFINPDDSAHTPQANLKLANSLLEDKHMSPFEHIIMSLSSESRHRGDFVGNVACGLQFRKLAEHCLFDSKTVMRMWENIMAEEKRKQV